MPSYRLGNIGCMPSYRIGDFPQTGCLLTYCGYVLNDWVPPYILLGWGPGGGGGGGGQQSLCGSIPSTLTCHETALHCGSGVRSHFEVFTQPDITLLDWRRLSEISKFELFWGVDVFRYTYTYILASWWEDIYWPIILYNEQREIMVMHE